MPRHPDALERRTRAPHLGLIGGILILLTAAAIGCGDAERNSPVKQEAPTPAGASPTEAARAALPGDTAWVPNSLDGRPLIHGSFLIMKIDGNWLVGFDGCNSYGGQSEDGAPIADADGVFSSPPLARTQMECLDPEGIMDQADAYISALMEGERYRVAGDRLEIHDAGGSARLVFFAQAPLPGSRSGLKGTAWRLLKEGDTEDNARAATLAFLDDRLVAGVTACRPYLATYNESEGGVGFPSMSMLRLSQECSEESRRLEGEYGDFLTWANEYSVYEQEGSPRLAIRSERGRTLDFEPLPSTVEDLADTEWTLVALVELHQLEVGMWNPRSTRIIQGTEVTVSFGQDGISGESGCNSYAGQASAEDGSITIDVQSLAYTERVCKDTDGQMEQEESYLDLLPSVTRYGIYGDGLFMRTEDDVFLLFQSKLGTASPSAP